VGLQDGARTLRSGRGVGAGPGFVDPCDVESLASRDAAVVIDAERDAVVLVDLATGARTTLSGPGVGGGPIPLGLQAVAVDAPRERVLVVDRELSALLAVSLSNGDRTTISSDAVGTGPSLVGPRALALDLGRNRALVVLAVSSWVVAVDLGTGNRTLLSTPDAVPGPERPLDIVVDVFRDRALLADAASSSLSEIDLVTGARTILSGGFPTIGRGPEWSRPSGVALHLSGVPLVVDGAVDALFEVAPSGDRRVLSGVAHGSGPSFARPSAVSLLPGGWPIWMAPGFLVADAEARALYAWSQANRRELWSGPSRGSGPPFVELTDVAASSAGLVTRCVFALDAGLRALISVDEVSGDRTLVSGPGVGTGPELERPIRFVLEPSSPNPCAGTALVLDRLLEGGAALVRVDLSSGARSIVSDATHGFGGDFVDPVALELSGAAAFVLDAGLPGVLSVDPITGDREVAFLSPSAFVAPTDLVLHHAAHAFLIADAGVPALFSANWIPGTLTVVSGLDVGSGPSLPVPASLVFELSPTLVEHGSVPLVHVADAARGAVLTIEVPTGNRVLATK
jgi:hypothetical protein